MVECAALEMRFTGNRNVGSNPTLSAIGLSCEAFSCTENYLRAVLFTQREVWLCPFAICEVFPA